jgi:hypothetical protein
VTRPKKQFPCNNRSLPEFVDRRPGFSVLGKAIPFVGLFARHVRGLTLSNVRVDTVNPEVRAAIDCDNVENMEIVGAKLGPTFSGDSVIRLRQVKDVTVRDCLSLGTAKTWVCAEQTLATDVTVAPTNRHHSAQAIELRP